MNILLELINTLERKKKQLEGRLTTCPTSEILKLTNKIIDINQDLNALYKAVDICKKYEFDEV